VALPGVIRHGGDRKSGEAKSKAHDAPLISSFLEDASKKTGQHRATIKRDIQIATNILEDVRDQLRETPLADNKTDLLKLAWMEKEEQLMLSLLRARRAG
jgi:ParB family transcriptional regulator, chromosome partitioning protein